MARVYEVSHLHLFRNLKHFPAEVGVILTKSQRKRNKAETTAMAFIVFAGVMVTALAVVMLRLLVER